MFTQTSYLLLTFKDFHLKIHDNRSFVVDAEITYRPFLTSLLHTNREKKLDFKNYFLPQKYFETWSKVAQILKRDEKQFSCKVLSFLKWTVAN